MSNEDRKKELRQKLYDKGKSIHVARDAAEALEEEYETLRTELNEIQDAEAERKRIEELDKIEKEEEELRRAWVDEHERAVKLHGVMHKAYAAFQTADADFTQCMRQFNKLHDRIAAKVSERRMNTMGKPGDIERLAEELEPEPIDDELDQSIKKGFEVLHRTLKNDPPLTEGHDDED